MATLAAGTRRGGAGDLGMRGPSTARTAGPAAADRSAVMARPGRTVRSWPLLVLAAPAAAEVWSGWVGIAQRTGFGQVSPLPGIWPSLHLDTTITLPVGVEAYAAYALRAWLASGHTISARTRRFAKWSAIGSFALGMAGQVAYHLLAQAGVSRAPWAITTVVSCLPVLVLAMGTTLAHMLRADAALDAPDRWASGPATSRSPESGAGQTGPVPDQTGHRQAPTNPGPRGGIKSSRHRDEDAAVGTTGPAAPAARAVRAAYPEMDQARVIARRLAASGKSVSRRALRSGGVRGSNETLNALARRINAEMAAALGGAVTGLAEALPAARPAPATYRGRRAETVPRQEA